MIYLIITLVIHTFYTIFSKLYLGYIDKSYSDTFYKLRGWHKVFFWLWILGISVPSIYYLRDISFISAFGALFVLGVFFSSYTVQKPQRTTFHVISATGGILLILAGFIIQLANWIEFNIFNYSVFLLILLSIIIMPIGKIKKGVKNHTYWIESVFIYIPVLTLLINEIFYT